MAVISSSSSSSMATATAGLLPRVPTNQVSPFLALPSLPSSRSSLHPLRISLEWSRSRLSSFQVKASSSTEEAFSIDELKEKWDKIENKSTVFLLGGGAVVAIWLSSTLVGAVNSVPVLPNILELVGVGYTGWFVYRYLLFKSGRKDLAEEIESLKKKIAETE